MKQVDQINAAIDNLQLNATINKDIQSVAGQANQKPIWEQALPIVRAILKLIRPLTFIKPSWRKVIDRFIGVLDIIAPQQL